MYTNCSANKTIFITLLYTINEFEFQLSSCVLVFFTLDIDSKQKTVGGRTTQLNNILSYIMQSFCTPLVQRSTIEVGSRWHAKFDLGMFCSWFILYGHPFLHATYSIRYVFKIVIHKKLHYCNINIILYTDALIMW